MEAETIEELIARKERLLQLISTEDIPEDVLKGWISSIEMLDAFIDYEKSKALG